LAFYFSNPECDLPVRDVKKAHDNKADPNIETGTWGMFSTCMPAIRKGIVERGDKYLFFYTTWRDGRKLTGYYQLKWYVATGCRVRNRNRIYKFLDFALRAERVHFVREPIRLEGPKFSRVSAYGNSIRGFAPRESQVADVALTRSLKDALDRQSNATDEYRHELHRMEDDNLKGTGYRYPSWERHEGFSEDKMGGFVL
jgi:hypothetical protein